jgi:two-component system sensor histidine kinase/response regulator
MAKTILAVDDDENILNLERAILAHEGFEVIAATSAKEALEAVAGQSVDLILLDIVMPEMDGFELCLQLKADPRFKDVPVVFLTARGGGEALAEGFESGGVMYIRKPFTAAKLLAVVGTLLETGPYGLK